MKILFVTSMYPTDEKPGFGSFVKHQADGLRNRGHNVDVLLIKGYEGKMNYIKAAISVIYKTFRGRYDIVHAHYGLSGYSAIFRWNSRLVITLHGSDALVGRVQPFLTRIICNYADEVISVSKQIANKIPSVIIPCGVDLKLFRPIDRRQARDKLGISKDKDIILFPFNPERRIKRYDLAKAAVDRIVKRGFNAELLTVYDIRNHDMPWYYSAADVMILASDSEGSPTSVKECLACNTPVVSTKVGDVEEILYGISGVSLCEKNEDSISEGLMFVLNYKKNRIATNCRSAMNRYDQISVIKEIEGVYERVIATKK